MANKNPIIVICGESGSGKSYIVRNIFSRYPKISIIQKFTTRSPRNDESDAPEIKGGISKEIVRNLEYTYFFKDNWYGISAQAIEFALNKDLLPCIITTDEDTFKKLNQNYPEQVLLFHIISYLDEEAFTETFKIHGRSTEELKQRLDTIDNPITSWAFSYPHQLRSLVNPFFSKSCPVNISQDVIAQRIEHVLSEELGFLLGSSLINGNGHGLYSYLYHFSKNRPNDAELAIVHASPKKI